MGNKIKKLGGKDVRGKASKNPNTEVIKFLAACLVIVSHAYPLNLGSDAADGLATLTNGQMNFGAVAVSIFFTFSGYYLARSVCKYQRGWDYFRGRAKRIFPALWIAVLLTVFLVGPLFTTLPLVDYFKNGDTWRYFGNAMLIPMHNLPGVFTDNIYPQTVNGALWTLPVETLCYIALWVLYKMNLLSKKKVLFSIPLFGLASGALLLVGADFPILLSAWGPGTSFYVAIYLQLYGDEIYCKTKLRVRWGAYTVLVIGSIVIGIANVVMRFFIPLITIEIARNAPFSFSGLGKLGGYSYEMYLLGWPIQQMLVALFGPMQPYLNAAVAIVLCVLLAIPLNRAASCLAKVFEPHNEASRGALR